MSWSTREARVIWRCSSGFLMRWTSAVADRSVVVATALVALLSLAGCAHFPSVHLFQSTVVSYLPLHSALHPKAPPPTVVQQHTYGHQQTVWRSWEGEWIDCESPKSPESTSTPPAPDTHPPAAPPPDMQPPVTQPSVTQPPVTQSFMTPPTMTRPLVAQIPVSQPDLSPPTRSHSVVKQRPLMQPSAMYSPMPSPASQAPLTSNTLPPTASQPPVTSSRLPPTASQPTAFDTLPPLVPPQPSAMDAPPYPRTSPRYP